jgi:protein-disulfide isomerase
MDRIHFFSIVRRLLVPAIAILASTAGCATADQAVQAPTAAAPATATPAAAAPETGDQRMLGSAAAPVMIIEFTDLQCPYCARFATQTWPKLKATYVDTGKVRFATRDLPLPMHSFALPAAIAARCAGQQGKYWEFREALFREQSRLGTEPYAELASTFGLDAERFARCRADPAVLQSVRADIALAASSDIESTPSFVIGRVINNEFAGEVISGAKPFEVFQQRIDSLLQQAQQ